MMILKKNFWIWGDKRKKNIFNENSDKINNDNIILYELKYNSEKIDINDLSNKILNDKPIKFEINIYKYIINNIHDYKNFIIKDDNNKIKLPFFPIFVRDKIDLNFYYDIYKYLYAKKNNLTIDIYPNNIIKITNKSDRDYKKREIRLKTEKFYLDNDNILYKKIKINN